MVTDEKSTINLNRTGETDDELKQAEATFAASLAFLQARGIQLPDSLLNISDWLTIKRYAEKYSVTTQVVTNWIARGVIPTDCVKDLPELNDLRLVKDQPYR